MEIDYNAPINISFKLDGESLKEAVDLRELSVALVEFISILDNSYSIITNQARLSNAAKNRFSVTALEIKRNSIEFNIELAIKTAQMLAPLFGWENPYTIWNFTIRAFDYLKYVSSLIKKKIQPQVQINAEAGANVIYGDNNTIIIADKRIVEVAERSFNNYQRLSKAVDGNKIKSISVGEINDGAVDKQICLDEKTKDLFDECTKIDDKPINVSGDILQFNKENMAGKIRVYGNQEISEGEYNFSVIGNQNKDAYIDAMGENAISAKILTENKFDNIKGNTISRLQIIELAPK